MKIFSLLCFFCLFLVPAPSHAGNNTFNSNYPSPLGSYKSISLENFQVSSTPICSSSTAGMLFFDPYTSANGLELCASTLNGASYTWIQVPFPQVCFSRFSNSSTPLCPSSLGYTSIGVSDQFNTGGGHTVYSTVCCSGPVTINGTTLTQVL